MSAYSDYMSGAITEEEFIATMRRECGDDREEVPFYTDDPDDPHWRCENCAHCKEFHALKPAIHFTDYVDDKGYVHNNPEKPIKQNLSATWSKDKYVLANLCEVTNHQMLDDDYCAEFTEREE